MTFRRLPDYLRERSRLTVIAMFSVKFCRRVTYEMERNPCVHHQGRCWPGFSIVEVTTRGIWARCTFNSLLFSRRGLDLRVIMKRRSGGRSEGEPAGRCLAQLPSRKEAAQGRGDGPTHL